MPIFGSNDVICHDPLMILEHSLTDPAIKIALEFRSDVNLVYAFNIYFRVCSTGSGTFSELSLQKINGD